MANAGTQTAAAQENSGCEPPQPSTLAHHFTVDVEEYFQVSAFEPYISRVEWSDFESRVAIGVERLLDVMDRFGARGTFFVLGWVAERHRTLVESISQAGHEVASHGWGHRRVMTMHRDEFRDCARRSKEALEDITGRPVLGFRAPTFSIIRGCEWALDVLIEEGYRYDSSLFPVRRPSYGYPGGKRDPHWIQRDRGALAEVPPTTLRIGGVNLPAGGGAYFRTLPYAFSRAAIRQCERRGARATIYLHPWEVDPDQPKLEVGWVARMRHYAGMGHTLERLQRLFSEFRFQAIRDSDWQAW